VTFEGHFRDVLTIVTLCAQLTRDLLALAKFFVHLFSFSVPRKTLPTCRFIPLGSIWCLNGVDESPGGLLVYVDSQLISEVRSLCAR